MTFLDFFISHRKKLSLSRGYIGRWGHAIVAVAVVEPGLNKSQCMDCPPGQKKSRCGEVAVSGGSTVEMLFFNFILGLTHWGFSEFFFFFFFSLDDQTSVAIRLTLERILRQDGQLLWLRDMTSQVVGGQQERMRYLILSWWSSHFWVTTQVFLSSFYYKSKACG